MTAKHLLITPPAAGGAAPTADVLWLDASVTASITTGVATAVRVTSWADQTASGNDVSRSIGADAPIYDTGFGSSTLATYTIPFFGAGDYLSRTSGVLGPHVGDMSIYMVIGEVVASADGMVIADASASSANPNVCLRKTINTSTSTQNMSYFIRNDANTLLAGSSDTNVDLPATGFSVYSVIDNGSSLTQYLDGSAPSSATNPQTYSLAGSFTTDRFAIGVLLRSTVLVAMAGFELAELRVYSSAHDATTRAAVESELATKWGL